MGEGPSGGSVLSEMIGFGGRSIGGGIGASGIAVFFWRLLLRLFADGVDFGTFVRAIISSPTLSRDWRSLSVVFWMSSKENYMLVLLVGSGL